MGVDFNSRPSARGDLKVKTYIVHAGLFQFTPLREGRRLCIKTVYNELLFQFTPLREGRPMANAQYLLDVIFQFTPLREGRRIESYMA